MKHCGGQDDHNPSLVDGGTQRHKPRQPDGKGTHPIPTQPARAPDQAVRIVDHDPAWPDRFGAERGPLEPIPAPWASGGIHHVGSTAVPAMAAKPVRT